MGQLRWKPQFEQMCVNNLGKSHNLKERVQEDGLSCEVGEVITNCPGTSFSFFLFISSHSTLTFFFFFFYHKALLLLLSRFSRVRLCATPQMAAYQAPPSLGFSRQEHWSGLPFPSPMHESEKSK